MFSKTTEYALRAVLYIAKNASIGNKLSIQIISEGIGSPKSFTAKILQKLTKDNVLVTSVSGPNGGLYISDEGLNTSMMKVLKLMDDDHVISKCVLGLSECSEINPCPMHHRYKLIKPLLMEMFEHKTIRELVNELSDEKLRFTEK